MNEQEVITKIGKHNWKKFLKFIEGQTCGYKDGVFDYYEKDVENFTNKINGHPIFFD